MGVRWETERPLRGRMLVDELKGLLWGDGRLG